MSVIIRSRHTDHDGIVDSSPVRWCPLFHEKTEHQQTRSGDGQILLILMNRHTVVILGHLHITSTVHVIDGEGHVRSSYIPSINDLVHPLPSLTICPRDFKLVGPTEDGDEIIVETVSIDFLRVDQVQVGVNYNALIEQDRTAGQTYAAVILKIST